VVGGPGEHWEREFCSQNQMPEDKVAERLRRLDRIISRKFSTVWVSVRKAFLELDQDRDGLIEAADIARYFGDEDSIDLGDLKKLMHEKKRLRDK